MFVFVVVDDVFVYMFSSVLPSVRIHCHVALASHLAPAPPHLYVDVDYVDVVDRSADVFEYWN
jgi:hypothetical protein